MSIFISPKDNSSVAKRPLSTDFSPSPSVIKPKKLQRPDCKSHNLDTPSIMAAMGVKEGDILGQTVNELQTTTENELNWEMVIKALHSCTVEINKLKEENSQLKNKVSTAIGRTVCLEHDLQKANDKLVELEWREMRQNLVFYNIEEKQNENISELIPQILIDTLEIPPHLISNLENNRGVIAIDIVHRLGRKVPGKNRPTVVRFTTRAGKDTVLSYSKKKKSSVKVAEQYPPEMKERRTAQIGALKNYREIHKDSNTSVELVKDKFLVGNQVIDNKNKLQSSPTDSVPSIANVIQTPVKEVHRSFFQGHAIKVSSIKDASAAIQALYQSSQIANSDHLMYAYTVTDDNGMRICGNSDEGEWSASRLLADLIAKRSQSNILVAVSRRHDGPNLGQKRFSIISSVASEALQSLINID